MFQRVLAGFLLIASTGASAAQPEVVPLWPDLQVPQGLPAEKTIDRSKDDKLDRSITNVTHPTITVYLPDADKPTAAIVICPGGGYGSLAIDKEGHDVARWLNSIQVAGMVLKYRMPHPEITGDGKPWPLVDAQRAIRLARARAKEWNLDPSRVGIMGFSAGGHLASTVGTHFEPGDPAATDPITRFPTRPDFMVLVYPVITLRDPLAHRGSRTNLLGKMPDAAFVGLYSNDEQVTVQTPPTFLVHAKDDGVKVENSVRFAAALEAVEVPHQLVLFEKGGHGFGLGTRGGEPAAWPEQCAKWMREMKLLER